MSEKNEVYVIAYQLKAKKKPHVTLFQKKSEADMYHEGLKKEAMMISKVQKLVLK